METLRLRPACLLAVPPSPRPETFIGILIYTFFYSKVLRSREKCKESKIEVRRLEQNNFRCHIPTTVKYGYIHLIKNGYIMKT